MTIKVKFIIKLLLFILILFECEFNYMVSLGFLSDPEYVKIIKAFLCMAIFFLYKKKCFQEISLSKELRMVQMLFLIVIPINFIMTYGSGMSFLDSFLSVAHYFFIFLIEPICALLYDSNDRKQLFSFILICGCITLLVRSYMAFYYHYNNHSVLFPLLSLGAGTKTRYDNYLGYDMLRVYPSSLGVVVFLGFVYLTIASQKIHIKIISLMISCFVMLYYVFVYQARGYVVVFGIEFFILFLAKRYDYNKGFRNLLKYLMAVLILCAILSSNFVYNLIQSFGVDSELGLSTSIRLTGINYIFQKIIYSFPFGIGENSGFDSAAGYIYTDDYGFLGFIVKNNILGFFIYSLLCIYLFGWLYKLRNSPDFLPMLTTVLIFISGMLIVDNFLPRKIAVIPFILAVFEYYRQKSIINKTNRNIMFDK